MRAARPSVAKQRRQASRGSRPPTYQSRGVSAGVTRGILSGVSEGLDNVNPFYFDDAVLDVDGDGDFDFVDFLIIAFFAAILFLAVYGFFYAITSKGSDTSSVTSAEVLYVDSPPEYYVGGNGYEEYDYFYPGGDVFEVDAVLAAFIDYEACLDTEYGELFAYCPVFEVVYDWDTNQYFLLEPTSYIGWFVFEGELVEYGAETVLELYWIYIYAEYETISEWDLEAIDYYYCEPTALPEQYYLCPIDGEYYLMYGEFEYDSYYEEELWYAIEYVYLLEQ